MQPRPSTSSPLEEVSTNRPDVLLIRHGQTDLNFEGRVQGWLPEPLNATGRRQANRTGEAIAATHDIDRVVSSDLRRARETADIIAGHANIDNVETDERVREQNFGVHEGIDSAEFDQVVAEVDPTTPLEGGESLVDVRRRAEPALREWARMPGQTVMVSNSVTISQILGAVTGLGLEECFEQFDPENASITKLRVTDAGDVEVLRENITVSHGAEIDSSTASPGIAADD